VHHDCKGLNPIANQSIKELSPYAMQHHRRENASTMPQQKPGISHAIPFPAFWSDKWQFHPPYTYLCYGVVFVTSLHLLKSPYYIFNSSPVDFAKCITIDFVLVPPSIPCPTSKFHDCHLPIMNC